METLRSDLEPVRRALLADAEALADQLLADARADADRTTGDARRRAQQTIDAAVRHDEVAAAAVTDQALARARTDAGALVLGTRSEIYQRLVDETRQEAQSFRRHPDYPRLLDQLEQLARRQLGPDTTIDRDPTPDGGVTARSGSLRVDYSLTALADRALPTLADRVNGLWT